MKYKFTLLTYWMVCVNEVNDGACVFYVETSFFRFRIESTSLKATIQTTCLVNYTICMGEI